MKIVNNVRIAMSLAAAVWLAGCGSSGTMVSPDQAAQFKPGVTTETELIAKLGPPNNTSTYPDGSKTDTYLHVAMSMHAANFIPVVGIFAGGASHSTDSVTFTFDPRGVLKTTASSSSHQDMNSGLLNQK